MKIQVVSSAIFNGTSCNRTSYDTSKDTCCPVHADTENGKLTKGLSERMSQCCGLEAYNPLNEICCNETVKPKPSHDAQCCGNEPYDPKMKLCCSGNPQIKLSAYHRCCYGRQFDSLIEKCCQDKFPRIQLKISDFDNCVKNIEPDGHQSTCQGQECRCDEVSGETKVCCKSTTEKFVYLKKDGFQCCGIHYYNTSLWTCNSPSYKLSPRLTKLNTWETKALLILI